MLPDHDVAETEAMVRSSIMLPPSMDAEVSEIARRTFSTRAQVIRQLIAESLISRRERERSKAVS